MLFGNLYSFVLQENKASGRTFTKHLRDIAVHWLSVQFMCLPSLFFIGTAVGWLLGACFPWDCVTINDLLLCLGATVLQDFVLMVLAAERTNLTNFINSSLV